MKSVAKGVSFRDLSIIGTPSRYPLDPSTLLRMSGYLPVEIRPMGGSVRDLSIVGPPSRYPLGLLRMIPPRDPSPVRDLSIAGAASRYPLDPSTLLRMSGYLPVEIRR